MTVESVRVVRSLPNISGTQRRYYTQVLRQFHDGKPITVKKPESTEGWRTHSFHERLTELTACERDIMYQAWFVPKNSLQASPAIAGRVIVDHREMRAFISCIAWRAIPCPPPKHQRRFDIPLGR